jgi:radical SAM-linked protein
MKIRIKFIKSGPLKFVGHLDVMRYFQKAFRRGEIDVEYSKGYSPHQLISFAAPLGVGLTSDGEYLDVQVHTSDSKEVMIDRINAVMAEDIRITDYIFLPDNTKNAMSSVAGADYLVSIRDGYDFFNEDEFQNKFIEFYNREQVVITKKSKKSENEVDIRPMIYHTAFTVDEFYKTIGQTSICKKIETSVADSYENGIKVYMQLATGSANNLKPELVMEAFCQYAGIEFNEFAYQVHRMEVYGEIGNEENRKLVALDRIHEI